MGTTNNFGRDYGQQASVGTVVVDPASLAALEGTTAAQGAPTTVANAWPVLEASRAAAAADVHEPASNTAAVVTYAAGGAGVYHVIGGVCWSYSGVPTGGNLKITDDGATVFSIDIVAAGPGAIVLPRPKKNAVANKALVITLTAGGSGVTGKLSITSHWTEA